MGTEKLREREESCLEECGSGVCVKGTEWVVQQVDVGVSVHCPCQLNSLLLPSTHVDASLPNLRLVSEGKLSYVLV
jgi:hypothetical protein